MSTSPISLGLSLGPRSGAAVLLGPHGILASAYEERASARRAGLPLQAIQHCLQYAGLKDLSRVDVLSLQSRHARDWTDFLANQFSEDKSWIEGLLTFPSNLRHELRFRSELRQELEQLGGASSQVPEVLLVNDEQAIAQGLRSQTPRPATGFLLMDMPFARLATGLWQIKKENGQLENVWMQEFPQSLELLVANLAGFCGFRGRMGQRQFLQLSEYGEPRFVDLIQTELLQVEKLGRYRVNQDRLSLEPLRESEWAGIDPLIEDGPRKSDQPISSREIDLSHSLLHVIQEWQKEMEQVAREELLLSELLIRGQGPLFDRLKSGWKKMSLPCRLLGLQDEPILMAAGAAIEALELKEVNLQMQQPLNLRPEQAYREYLRAPKSMTSQL